MKLRLYLSSPGAIEGSGPVQHVRRPMFSATFCGQFVPAGKWEALEVELDDADGLPAELEGRLCLSCSSQLDDAITSLQAEGA